MLFMIFRIPIFVRKEFKSRNCHILNEKLACLFGGLFSGMLFILITNAVSATEIQH